MDREASALHTTKPRHLSLGKLMDGDFETRKHFVVGELPCQIFRQKLILQAIVYKVVSRDALIEKGLYLIDHALLKTDFQSSGNFLAPQFATDIDTDDKGIHLREFPFGHGMLQVVSLYLNRPDSPLARINIRCIVHIRTILLLQL